jgi:outer membrane protein
LELGASEKLTLQEARDLALRQHPRITAAEFKALAARQAVLQTRAALLPTFNLNAVAVGAADANTRYGAPGGINNPAIFERAAGGLNVSQLLTDFGRTDNLLGGAKDKARAEEAGTDTARAQLVLAVSAAYFGAQQAQSVLRVVDQTVTNRQTLLDQVSALAKNQLKSDLDVSFARVALEEARLLQLRARNDLDAAFTALGTLLGEREPRRFTLAEESSPGGPPHRWWPTRWAVGPSWSVCAPSAMPRRSRPVPTARRVIRRSTRWPAWASFRCMTTAWRILTPPPAWC